MYRLGFLRVLVHQCDKVMTCNQKTRILKGSPHLNNQVVKCLCVATPETEKEFLVRLKNDPDNFGVAEDTPPPDPGDLKEQQHFEHQPTQKSSTKQYGDIIKELIRKRKIKEAIDVVETKMLREDRVKPESYIYNLLLGACGQVGYTKKAFSLYNQMKRRGLRETGGTYTALFNACANSPWPEDGLTRARHLQEIMLEKMYEPNDTNYNAMIKAFGRCGDLSAAFGLVDEMLAKRFNVKDDTVNFLLMACIQDKEAGFRHALLVWRKLIDMNIPPSSYSYNLMLRCVRDCRLGDAEATAEAFDKLLRPEKLQLRSDGDLMENESVTCDRPNLMAKVPHLGSIVAVSEIVKAEDRLLLVGGLNGFLENMTENDCTPDIKTFTQLLDCIPGSLAAEKELKRIMKKSNVKPDVDFFNMLIKKRSIRFDYENAKAVLVDLQKLKYMPNLITYGVLALGCKTKQEALELLAEMKAHSYSLNTEILGAMLKQACHHRNFLYVLEIMEISLREKVKPNKIFMERLSEFKKKCKEISNDKDNPLAQKTTFQKGFRIFLMRYKTWLEEVEVDDTEEAHPWTQYRQTTETDVSHYKDKATKFKARHLSLFRVKTSAKYKNEDRKWK